MRTPLVSGLAFALALGTGACGGPTSSAPMAVGSPAPTAQGSDPASEPQTEEDRAQVVLNELEAWCADHTPECGATLRPDAYPDIEVSDPDRRFVGDHDQELRSLGIQLRWDPGTNHLEIERGNTPTFGGDLRDDP